MVAVHYWSPKIHSSRSDAVSSSPSISQRIRFTLEPATQARRRPILLSADDRPPDPEIQLCRLCVSLPLGASRLSETGMGSSAPMRWKAGAGIEHQVERRPCVTTLRTRSTGLRWLSNHAAQTTETDDYLLIPAGSQQEAGFQS